MDPKMKTVLAVVVGIVIGATLLGGAIAVPAAFHALAFRAGGAEGSFGMMGQRSESIGGPGMMGPRSGAIGGQGMMGPGSGAIDGPGMMGPQGGRGQFAPQDGSGVCPNGETCPNVPTEPTTES